MYRLLLFFIDDLPQPRVVGSSGSDLPRDHREPLWADIDFDVRDLPQVVVPAGLALVAALRSNDQVSIAVARIGQRCGPGLTGFGADGVQQQAGCHTRASDARSSRWSCDKSVSCMRNTRGHEIALTRGKCHQPSLTDLRRSGPAPLAGSARWLPGPGPDAAPTLWRPTACRRCGAAVRAGECGTPTGRRRGRR